ncbi:MAG: sulfite exporter TauE/SafE family protein [bacterium]|nr:sulfite exporter TauE/SafE family protein [bacterium]
MDIANQRTYTFYINGMHCQSCVGLTEGELKTHPLVSSAKSNLATRTVEVTGNFGDMASETITKELTAVLAKHGYSISTERQEKTVNWKEFTIAAPIAIGFLLVFFLLQKLGIVNLISAGNVSYGTAFVVGIVASLSTCMAVVGGLLLSMSATFALKGDRVRPQLLFHIGRIVAFFILGGVIGVVGSAFQLGTIGTFAIGLIIGLVMLILGINLLDVFHFTKRLQLTMPSSLSKKVLNITKLNHTLTPALVGIATFFLPCGFTQSMQVYTLSTGSFFQGGLTMLFFALGTFPVLALVSFSSFSIGKSAKAGIFFKSAGLIVILFAIFNILNSFVALGWLAPIFNF